MKVVRKIGDPRIEWPTLLEVGAEVFMESGRKMKVTSIDSSKGTVTAED